jgi:hypothetical protein
MTTTMLLASLLTCTGGPLATSPVEAPVTSAPAVQLSAQRSSTEVVLSWTLENRGSEPLWLADVLLGESTAGAIPQPGRAVVRQPPAAGAPLMVTVGYTAPYDLKLRELFPIIRELPAGATAHGTVRIPLPLASYHPMEQRPTPIERTPERVTVRIGAFRSAPQTSPVRLGTGEVVQTLASPSVREQSWMEASIDWP